MDEVVFVHPPKADQLLVKPGFCWRLRAMNGTRTSSRLWANKVKFVFRWAGCFVLGTVSMVFWHPVDKNMLDVWRDVFGAAGVTRVLATADHCAVRELRE